MSTLMQYKHEPVPNQSISPDKHESENLASSRITALDMVGLTWIFKKDEDILEELSSLIGKRFESFNYDKDTKYSNVT